MFSVTLVILFIEEQTEEIPKLSIDQTEHVSKNDIHRDCVVAYNCDYLHCITRIANFSSY